MAERYVNYNKLLEERHRLGLDESSKIHKVNAFNNFIDNLPTADVALTEVMEQIKWERDIAIEQLASYGVCLGEKKELVEVKHGEWIETKEWYFDEYAQSEYQRKCYECSICKRTELYKEPYCHCGAKMDGGNVE